MDGATNAATACIQSGEGVTGSRSFRTWAIQPRILGMWVRSLWDRSQAENSSGYVCSNMVFYLPSDTANSRSLSAESGGYPDDADVGERERELEREDILATIDMNNLYSAGEELPTLAEAAFHFRLLLEDFKTLVDIVKTQWSQYLSQGADLGAVAVTTELALRWARQIEQDARQRFTGRIQHPLIHNLFEAKYGRMLAPPTKGNVNRDGTQDGISAFLIF
ncbi:hypothetical protein QBC44DRAFT_98021 [Cladorrhinum sp. PSN332]|nr:hypothetical protein QBC44DRAFT_98021 [Cladorrhinum sp. PSN332]